jgi:L-seryl-tRNA(Ser) seleniumtransferase
MVAAALRTQLAAARTLRGGATQGNAELLKLAGEALGRAERGTLVPVINATGVILHTNLGRAPLSAATIRAMQAVASGYSSLEYDLELGQRGSRHEHVTELLRHLTGAEAALVVNNNAASVLLALAALAADREVVISRGQLVEIGGGFRIPDVLRQSGARLVEVGTTNRTYAEDYAQAIGEGTALLLRVHASNFRVTGFVHQPALGELVALGHGRGLLVVDDLGSGSLLATERYGLGHEPMVQESVADGVDLVCFSADKLLGGPQAGILVGSNETVARLRRHPLTRALRPDKATIAGLRATLRHYLRGEAEREIPVLRMLACPAEELRRRTDRILAAVPDTAAVASRATVGGGSLPGETLPSWAVAAPAGGQPHRLAEKLRRLDRPIVGRIAEDRLLLDLRTVDPADDGDLIHALTSLSD